MLGTKSIAPSHIVINVTVRQNKVLHDRRQKELTATRLAAGSRSRRGTTFDMAEGDAALGEVIRRELERNLVAGENSDVVLAHLAVGVGDELVTVFKLDAITSVGEHFEHLARHFN